MRVVVYIIWCLSQVCKVKVLVWIVSQESVIVIVMWVVHYMTLFTVLIAASLWSIIVAVSEVSGVLRVPVWVNGSMECLFVVLECFSLLDGNKCGECSAEEIFH